MRIKVLGSANGSSAHQFAATYVVDDQVAIDAGCLGFAPLQEQFSVRHIVLSHAHLDHVASLPIFLDNIYHSASQVVNVYGSPHVISTLQNHFFNDHVWPDLCRMSENEPPFLNLVSLNPGDTIQLEHLSVTPIELNHVVPTFGFLVASDNSTVALISDTGPTQQIWDECNKCEDLKAVFLESAFPNSMAWLAEKAGHLTPDLFLAETRKLNRTVPIVVVHIKPAWYDDVAKELMNLNASDLILSAANQIYEF